MSSTWLIRMITHIIILMGPIQLNIIRLKSYPRRKVQQIFFRLWLNVVEWEWVTKFLANNFIRHVKPKLFHKGDSFLTCSFLLCFFFAGISNCKPSNTFLWLNSFLLHDCMRVDSRPYTQRTEENIKENENERIDSKVMGQERTCNTNMSANYELNL